MLVRPVSQPTIWDALPSRNIKTPFAFARFQQKLDHAFFVEVWRVIPAACWRINRVGFADGVVAAENAIVATAALIHWGDISGTGRSDAIRLNAVSADYSAAHGMNIRHRFQSAIREAYQKIDIADDSGWIVLAMKPVITLW